MQDIARETFPIQEQICECKFNPLLPISLSQLAIYWTCSGLDTNFICSTRWLHSYARWLQSHSPCTGMEPFRTALDPPAVEWTPVQWFCALCLFFIQPWSGYLWHLFPAQTDRPANSNTQSDCTFSSWEYMVPPGNIFLNPGGFLFSLFLLFKGF